MSFLSYELRQSTATDFVHVRGLQLLWLALDVLDGDQRNKTYSFDLHDQLPRQYCTKSGHF